MASRKEWDDLLQRRLLGAELASNNQNYPSSNKDILNKQIDAFEKLVSHAVSRFSVDRSHRLLLRIAEPPFPSSPKRISPKSNRDKNTSDNSNSPYWINSSLMDSIGKLREALVKLKRRTTKSNTDNLVISNIDIFLRDIQYMKNLKRYFDEKIYSVLYKYYYDPTDLLEDDEHRSKTDNVVFFMTEPEEIETKVRSRHKHSFMYGLDIDHLTEREQLLYAVEELYKINTKWENLIKTEDSINVEDFDLDSEVEVKDFAYTESTYSLLRLMPDLFVKCQKSVELSKLWWKQAIKIYKLDTDSPDLQAPAPISNYKQKMKDLIKDIDGKATEIRKQEHNVNIHQADLEFLEVRESRVQNLCDSSEKLEKHRDEVGESYRKLVQERQNIEESIENTVKGTKKYEELSSKLNEMNKQLIDQYRELNLLEYSLNIHQSEYNINMEVKPSFVVYSETSKVNMEKAKLEIERLQGEKRRMERRYLLMKTNHERMQEILSRVSKLEDQTKRPRTNHTYTIRKVTSEESRSMDVTALKPTAAYVFTKPKALTSSRIVEEPKIDDNSIVRQEQYPAIKSPFPIMTKSQRHKPAETGVVK